MSIRTIVEFNHDYANDLAAEDLRRLKRALFDTDTTAALNVGQIPQPVTGVRILAQRHHSDEITLTVKG